MTAPGWRGRIGIVQPAPGVMLEHEWPGWLPEGVLFPVTRVPLTSGTAEGYAALAARAPEAARDLASAGVDVVAFACTVGSLYEGVDAEAALLAAMSAAAGCPAIGLAETSVEALRKVRATRLAILTPYDDGTNAWVAACAEAQGFEVAGFIPAGCGIATVGDLAPEAVAELAVTGLADLPDVDAIWLPCTAMQTLDAIATIETASGLPAVSGSQALLWRGLRIVGAEPAKAGLGRLFD